MINQNQIIKTMLQDNNEIYVNSLDVAKFFDKEHSHLMDKIKIEIEKNKKIGVTDDCRYYRQSSYTDKNGRKQPCYLIKSDSKESLLQFLYSTFGKKIIRKESAYRDKLAYLYNGKVEVQTPLGFIDVLTANSIIEVKEFRGYLKALGQITAYGYYYPNHKKICAFYDYQNNGNIDEVISVLQALGIEVLLLDTKEEVIITDPKGNIVVNQLDLFNN